MKLAINTSYGGFELSKAALARLYNEHAIGSRLDKDGQPDFDRANQAARADTILIRTIEEMGNAACGANIVDDEMNLEIIEIPDNIEFEIMQYDGKEWVAEKHQKWGYDKRCSL